MHQSSDRQPLDLHPDRLFPYDLNVRGIARRLYSEICELPIISPHGHTDPRWFAGNNNFVDATELLLKPDHYVLRMLYSQGISLDEMGIRQRDGSIAEQDNLKIWRLFAANYHLYLGTPSRLWLDHVFAEVFGLNVVLNQATADAYYEQINSALASEAFKPRALFDRFNIEVLATTESPINTLEHHQTIRDSDWDGRVVTSFRPDPVVDPDFEGFRENIAILGSLAGENTNNWTGYLNALRQRRSFFQSMGATSTDHGHPTAQTADLDHASCQGLLDKALAGNCSAQEAEMFRAQLLTEMAGMSLDDGLVMQLHPGSVRNHNADLFMRYGRDVGADIPTRIEYVHALKPLLDRYGNHPDFTFILLTLDESSYSRELAPLAGHYPCLKLGPPWWFHDSPEGMLRGRRQLIETAGIYNQVGFIDDTRAFLSIPARHDVARRMDCRILAEWVAEHRISESDAHQLAYQLAYTLGKQAYKL